MFEFFRGWLVVVGVGLAAGGALLALAPDLGPLAILTRIIERRFWPGGEPEGGRELRRWLEGVLGGTMAGWGLTVAFLAAGPFADRRLAAWLAIAAGTALWYVLDTGRSATSRVWANVAVNTLVLVLVAVPLAGTLAEF